MCVGDCWEGDAYGQTSVPNPAIRQKSNAYPPACDLSLHVHIHCCYWTWPQGRRAGIKDKAEMSYPV